MQMYDELIKALRCDRVGDDKCSNCAYFYNDPELLFTCNSIKLLAEAADTIEKLQAQIHKEKWIPVAFSLPDAYEIVSVVFSFNDQQYEEVGFCLENGFWMCKDDGKYRKEYIQKREAIMWMQIEKFQKSAILWENPTLKSEEAE